MSDSPAPALPTAVGGVVWRHSSAAQAYVQIPFGALSWLVRRIQGSTRGVTWGHVVSAACPNFLAR